MVEATHNCPICGGQRKLLYPFGEKPIVAHCKKCSTESLWPLPTDEEIREYYSSYQTTNTPEDVVLHLTEISGSGIEFYLRKIGCQTMPRSSITFLEIGFGNGAGLFAAAKFGLKAYGIDLDPESVRRASEFADKHFISVVIACCDVSSLQKLGERFNIVKASQVIEHVKDPIRFLKEIAEVQQTGDYLIIECPNNEAGFWIIKNSVRGVFDRLNFYNSLKIKEHLWGYNKKSLPLLLNKAGYRVLFIRDYAVGNAIFQPETLVWYPSLREGMRRSIKQRSLRPMIYPTVRALDRMFSRLVRGGTGLAALCQKIDS